jgi:hypothetical protein
MLESGAATSVTPAKTLPKRSRSGKVHDTLVELLTKHCTLHAMNSITFSHITLSIPVPS